MLRAGLNAERRGGSIAAVGLLFANTMASNIGFDGGRDAVEKTKQADVQFVVYFRRGFPGSPHLREYGPALYDYFEREFEIVYQITEPLGEHLRIIKRKAHATK